jgi:hypothetical protein
MDGALVGWIKGNLYIGTIKTLQLVIKLNNEKKPSLQEKNFFYENLKIILI